MAEIDKSLPNVKQTINVPSPEEVQVELQEEQKPDQPVEVQPNEDGSVDINFDPKVFYDSLDNAIKYFEEGEEYEKCAHLFNIQEVVRRI